MLTKKQELTIQYVVDGMNKSEAVAKAFDCKNKNSAYSIATKLFKQQEVKDRLRDKQAILDNKTINDYVDFQHQAQSEIPTMDAVKKIKVLMNCGDKRVELQATDMYLKIIGGYKEKETKLMGLFGNVGKND